MKQIKVSSYYFKKSTVYLALELLETVLVAVFLINALKFDELRFSLTLPWLDCEPGISELFAIYFISLYRWATVALLDE